MERNLTHIALFAALIAVLGLIPKIDLAGGVPITAQSLGIMLCGTVLGAKRGAQLVMPRLGEPVEPTHVERVSPWWRTVERQPRREIPVETEATTIPKNLPWPVD